MERTIGKKVAQQVKGGTNNEVLPVTRALSAQSWSIVRFAPCHEDVGASTITVRCPPCYFYLCFVVRPSLLHSAI